MMDVAEEYKKQDSSEVRLENVHGAPRRLRNHRANFQLYQLQISRLFVET
jgi:hypothetical protein